MPFGGKYQLTPAQGMVARIPTLKRIYKYRNNYDIWI